MSRAVTVGTVALLTVTALFSFAANSLLCRLALRGGSIDPVTFTTVRLVSGAALLAVVARKGSWRAGDWVSGTMLWLYAAAFSFAYLGIDAGTGALLLFGSVQATMIGAGLVRREHPHLLEWAGLAVGFTGLVWLVFPGLSAPPLGSAAFMVLAGASWGVYSLRGKGAGDPIASTAGNFLRAAPIGLLTAVPFVGQARAEPIGLVLAVCSGALTSGLGYVAWYAVLRHLSTPRAAVLQLSVPVIAAAGAVTFLGESLSARLAVSAVLVIGGVSLALKAGRPR